jgi:hypothetical protein
LYRSFGLLHEAAESGEWLLGVVAVGVSLILTYGIPILSFVIAYQLGAVQLLSPIARMTAHLAVASPTLFTLIGVAFYIAGLPMRITFCGGLFGSVHQFWFSRAPRRANQRSISLTVRTLQRFGWLMGCRRWPF